MVNVLEIEVLKLGSLRPKFKLTQIGFNNTSVVKVYNLCHWKKTWSLLSTTPEDISIRLLYGIINN